MAPLLGLVTRLFFLVLTSDDVVAIPSPQSIGSDLTILTHNDLHGNTNTRQAATAVLSARGSKSKAQAGCEALQETLWNPGNHTELDFLRYLDYDKPADVIGQYWVGSRGNSTCRAITTIGKIETISCDTELPALCSQSAPPSSNTSSDTSSQWRTSVRTGDAAIEGYRDKFSFRFLGLKYASYPSRFTYSTYQAPSGNISALSYGHICPQTVCSPSTCSEDCLTLNIWTPYLPSSPSSSTSKKGVMLWVHGGAFINGYGSDPTFDGGSMASRGDVVVVTINYRLSTLGFLALDNSTARGNYWLSDQIAALDWVQNHIEDFGGDKERVTVFGQSAGASSVRALLASPRAKGKFTGAIVMSCPGGSSKLFSEYRTLAEAANKTSRILGEKGCAEGDGEAQLACLRALDPAKLVQGTVASEPVIDGTYLDTRTLLLDGTGPSLNVTLLTGVMHDDGFTAFSKTSNASQELTAQGYNATSILTSPYFPFPQNPNATRAIFNLTSRVATDAQFRCVTQSTAYAAAKNNVFPIVYSYEIDRSWQLIDFSPNPPTCEAPPSAEYPLGDTRLPYYKCHSGELYYVFGTGILLGRMPRDDLDIPFSQYMLDTWTAFGRKGDPNPEVEFLDARGYTNTSAVVRKIGAWEPTSVGNLKIRVLDVEPRDEGFREVEQCEVLEVPIGYYLD